MTAFENPIILSLRDVEAAERAAMAATQKRVILERSDDDDDLFRWHVEFSRLMMADPVPADTNTLWDASTSLSKRSLTAVLAGLHDFHATLQDGPLRRFIKAVAGMVSLSAIGRGVGDPARLN